MKLSYQDLHEGDDPAWEKPMNIAHGAGRAVGQLTQISYAKHAGGKTHLHKHDFETHKGRLPYLVAEKGPGMRVEIDAPPRDLQALGRAIDCILESGERILLGGFYVVTDDRGQVVMLASPFDVDVQIEQLGAIVTDRGIEE